MRNRRPHGGGDRAGERALTAPAGNTYDKYGSRRPIERRVVAGFRAALAGLADRARPESLVDVGCGEGVLTCELADRVGPGRRVVGVDVEHPRLRVEWRRRSRPNIEYRVGDASSLPFAEGEFDAACAIELLEHVEDPAAAVRELRRVARRWLVLSVPREPLWRACNVARGAYVGSLGNTPGHVHHWSAHGFASMASQYGEVAEVRRPLPWTMLLVRVGSERFSAPAAGTRRASAPAASAPS